MLNFENLNKTLIIAEAGVNHNGSFKTACELIEVAADAKVDVIKFQIFNTKELVTTNHDRANYQINSDGLEKLSQYKMLKNLELDLDDFIKLKNISLKKGLKFLCTPFDYKSMNFIIEKLKLSSVKISSGDVDNLPFILKAINSFEKVILSTGAVDTITLDKIINFLKNQSLIEELKKKLFILHCTSEYPAPIKEVNLNSIPFLKKRYGLNIGFSDHTEGIHVAVAAVAKGAKIIEKHITLDSNQEGPDHMASIEPDKLKKLVNNIRDIEKSFGICDKIVTKSESKNLYIIRKVIIANKNIKKGELFTKENIAFKRAGRGISPIEIENVLGRVAKKNFSKDELIKL